jgi:uncharacterized membrane protein YgdD (TMEM256/DUF423 family)
MCWVACLDPTETGESVHSAPWLVVVGLALLSGSIEVTLLMSKVTYTILYHVDPIGSPLPF